MLASPFAFYRGAAYLMASDLASTPRSGITVQACGDAHLSNFGLFGSPERALLFDINDFDETLPGPWEWDVKRLAASLTVAGRANGFSDRERREVVTASVRDYRTSMREFASMRNLDVWYSRLQVQEGLPRLRALLDKKSLKEAEQLVEKARTKDSLQAFGKLTHVVDGEPRIISDPPLIVPVEEMLSPEEASQFKERIQGLLRSYRRSLLGDRRHLLEDFRFVHAAHKVVGVGSVGTRAWIFLMLGRDDEDPLFLQGKEAQASVLAALRRQEPVRESGPAGRRGPAAHAGGERHLPRLGARRGPVRTSSATSTSVSCATGRARGPRRRWSPRR